MASRFKDEGMAVFAGFGTFKESKNACLGLSWLNGDVFIARSLKGNEDLLLPPYK